MYETELMREILSSPTAQKMIQQISPRYGKAYVFLNLIQVIGSEIDDLEKWTEEYKAQVVPQTATWTIEYWEKEYGIIPQPEWDLERRRENILLRIGIRGPMNPSRLAQIVSVAIGKTARIEENTGKNRFSIYISALPTEVPKETVARTLRQAKPVRLIYEIIYERHLQSNLYMGGILRTKKKITMRRN